MVEIFKTNVTEQARAESVLNTLRAQFAGCRANFDLNDCDHILRVEFPGEAVPPQAVISVLNQLGFLAKVLDDTPPLSSLNASALIQGDAPSSDNQNLYAARRH